MSETLSAVYMINGKPYRKCECDLTSDVCPAGIERAMMTCGFAQCFVPAQGVIITTDMTVERALPSPGGETDKRTPPTDVVAFYGGYVTKDNPAVPAKYYRQLEAANAELRARIEEMAGLLEEASEAKSCEFCPNQGWYPERDRATGDPVQVQCEFCYTEPQSIFNVMQRIAALKEAKP